MDSEQENHTLEKLFSQEIEAEILNIFEIINSLYVSIKTFL